MYVYIYLFNLSSYLFIYLSIHFIYLFYLYIYLFINLSIYSIYISNVKSQVFLFLNDMWPKNGPNFSLVETLRRKLFTSSRFSWGGVQPGCWGGHHPGQW